MVMEKQASILIADDNQNICQTLQDILSERGYEVSSVNDGYALLTHLTKSIPQVIILDIMMPSKGGLEVLNAIKSISPQTKVIIYTGYPQYQQPAYTSVVDRFLLKTDPPDKVLTAIEEVL